MLEFNFDFPTEVIHGKDVVQRNASRMNEFGRKALIVTGKKSAKVSGALQDVENALTKQKIKYQIFDRVENNPSLLNITAGAEYARKYAPDFIIGIGGGSPLDAAKAISVLVTNNIAADELFALDFKNKPLPVVAIPTTAGTGSEVTQYSVITVPERQTKVGFGTKDMFPRLALLDGTYAGSLDSTITRDTAVDALSHLIESYLSRRANFVSDIFVEAGLKLWGQCITELRTGVVSTATRESLLVASCFGGIAIAHTGTTVVHALGYPLTYYHALPHGRANGILMAEYLRYNSTVAKSRVEKILTRLNCTDRHEFAALMDHLVGHKLELSDEQINEYAVAASRTKNASHSLGDVTSQVCIDILHNSLKQK